MNQDRAFSVCILIILALAGWLAGYRFHNLDQNLTAMLSSLVNASIDSGKADSNLVQDLVRISVYLIFTISGALCGLKQVGKSAYLTLFQVLVILVVFQLLTIKANFAIGSTFTLATTTIASFYLFRIFPNHTGLAGAQEKEERVSVSDDNKKLERLNEELLLSRLKLIKSDEIDRRTLAADLHDQVLHGLKMVRQQFSDFVREGNADLVDKIDTGIARSMDQIREVMDNLSPSALENLNFQEAIEDLIRQGGSQASYRTRFRCDATEEDIARLNKIEKTLLYRIVQESVNNIIKHSGATKVKCLLSVREGKLHITLADNGKGFDTDKIDIDSRGVQYMLERASIINANINWRQAEKDTGTVVDISI